MKILCEKIPRTKEKVPRKENLGRILARRKFSAENSSGHGQLVVPCQGQTIFHFWGFSWSIFSYLGMPA
jgi:hypothetical protein